MPSRTLLGLPGLLLAVALPALGQEQDPFYAVTVRAGAQLPADLYSTAPPKLGAGPGLELAASYSFQPWLELELAGGWSRSTAPTRSLLLSTGPDSSLVLVSITPQLTTVPLFANARARWPAPWAVRPYLVAGAGGAHADLRDGATRNAAGWGPMLQAGAGVDLQPWSELRVGVEARWRWGRVTLREYGDSPYHLFSPGSRDANLGGLSLQAAAGWRF